MICFDVSGVYVIERKIKDGSHRSRLNELTSILSYNIGKLVPNIWLREVGHPAKSCSLACELVATVTVNIVGLCQSSSGAKDHIKWVDFQV